jgi:hypothetical protein
MDKSTSSISLRFVLLVSWLLTIVLFYWVYFSMLDCTNHFSVELLAQNSLYIMILGLAIVCNIVFLFTRTAYYSKNITQSPWEKLLISGVSAPRGYTLSVVLPLLVLISLTWLFAC